MTTTTTTTWDLIGQGMGLIAWACAEFAYYVQHPYAVLESILTVYLRPGLVLLVVAILAVIAWWRNRTWTTVGYLIMWSMVLAFVFSVFYLPFQRHYHRERADWENLKVDHHDTCEARRGRPRSLPYKDHCSDSQEQLSATPFDVALDKTLKEMPGKIWEWFPMLVIVGLTTFFARSYLFPWMGTYQRTRQERLYTDHVQANHDILRLVAAAIPSFKTEDKASQRPSYVTD